MTLRVIPSLLLVTCVFGLAGCGGPPSVEGPRKDDLALLSNLVSQIPDACSRPQALKALYAKDGVIPNDVDRKRISKLQFQVVGNPLIKEDTALVEVQIRNSASADPPGKVQWTCVKESDQWKLKTTPLP